MVGQTSQRCPSLTGACGMPGDEVHLMRHPSYHQLVLDLEHDIGERRDISGLHEGGGEAARKGVVTDLWTEAMQPAQLRSTSWARFSQDGVDSAKTT